MTFDEWFENTLVQSGVTEAVTDPAAIRKLAVLFEPSAVPGAVSRRCQTRSAPHI